MGASIRAAMIPLIVSFGSGREKYYMYRGPDPDSNGWICVIQRRIQVQRVLSGLSVHGAFRDLCERFLNHDSIRLPLRGVS